MALKVWIDGKLCEPADAKLSVYDHGTLYGDGVFEGIRVYEGRIFECAAHLKRLNDSAKAIRLTVPYSIQELAAAMEQTIKANNFTDCYIRLVVTRGTGYLGLSPNKCSRPCVFIIADTIELYARDLYETGMSVITSSIVRNHPSALSPRIKSLNYLNNILAKIEAEDAGAGEAIMLNHLGNVAECTGDNIFIVREGRLLTPGAAEGILEGITRGVIFKLCARLGINCQEQALLRYDLYTADECFLTGTAAEVIPVANIDARQIGAGVCGPVTRRLIEAFHRHVREA
jgi:branched-chain amino acid aminotransferase